MAGDDPSRDNFFIRFKNNVDDHIKKGVERLRRPQNPGSVSEHPGNEMPHAPQQPPQHHGNSGASDTSGTSGSDQVLTSAEDVYKWAESSPYSPFNLQHLPQPRPRDAPKGSEDSYTFRHAFEDLLDAGSGQNICPLDILAGVEYNRYYLKSDRVSLSAWVSGLGSQGRWDAYFPLSPWEKRVLSIPMPNAYSVDKSFDVGRGKFHPAQISNWRQSLFSRNQSWPLPDESAFHERAAKADKDNQRRLGDADTEEDLYEFPGALADLAEKMKFLRSLFYENLDYDSARPRNKNDATNDPRGILDRLNKNDRNDNDIKHSKSHHIATPSEPDWHPTDTTAATPATPSPGSPTTVTSSFPSPGAGTVVTTVRRESIGDGKELVTTTRQVFDNDNNLFSSSRYATTTSTRTWSTGGAMPGLDASFSLNLRKTARSDDDAGAGAAGGGGYWNEGENENENEEEESRQGKRSGWFWTK